MVQPGSIDWSRRVASLSMIRAGRGGNVDRRLTHVDQPAIQENAMVVLGPPSPTPADSTGGGRRSTVTTFYENGASVTEDFSFDVGPRSRSPRARADGALLREAGLHGDRPLHLPGHAARPDAGRPTAKAGSLQHAARGVQSPPTAGSRAEPAAAPTAGLQQPTPWLHCIADEASLRERLRLVPSRPQRDRGIRPQLRPPRGPQRRQRRQPPPTAEEPAAAPAVIRRCADISADSRAEGRRSSSGKSFCPLGCPLASTGTHT